MSWPTPQDYVEAVQNPDYAFQDAQLRTGRAELTPLGLPKVISGQFACVFKFVSSGKTWAVRCFVRELSDYQARYREISKALKQERFPFTADFEFLPQGIRIGGTWYPIIKMEWLSGQLLSSYIGANIASKDALLKVAQQIAEIHSALSSKGIAHGDLQHGNIIVSNGKLVLIDYDGMFVPALSGKGSHEIGHRNYQHPFRTENNFDEGVDRFSVWIIYLSLIALALDPRLWQRLKGGDDSLILKAADFKEPFTSAALQELKDHSNSSIQEIGYLIEELCYTSNVKTIRRFDRTFGTSIPTTEPSSPAGGRPDWLPEPPPTQKTTPEAPTTGLDWLTDHLSTEKIVFENRRDPAVPIMMLLAGSSFLAYLIPIVFGLQYLFLVITFQPVLALGVVSLLFLRFRGEDVVKQKRSASLEKAGADSEKRAKEQEVARYGKDISECQGQQKKTELSCTTELGKIDSRHQAALKKMADQLNQSRQNCHSQRVALNNKEANEKASVTTRFASQVNSLKNEISSATTQWNNEIAAALKAQQQLYLRNSLSRFQIDGATIHGIGTKLKARLTRAGIVTAADALYGRVLNVEGIGSQKATAIEQWRSSLIQMAQAYVPKSLDAALAAQIGSKFTSIVANKESQMRQLEKQRDVQVEAIASTYRPQREAIDNQIGAMEAKNAREVAEARSNVERERMAIKANAMSQYKEISERLAQGRESSRRAEQELSKIGYQANRHKKTLEAYSDITFVKWVAHQFARS